MHGAKIKIHWYSFCRPIVFTLVKNICFLMCHSKFQSI